MRGQIKCLLQCHVLVCQCSGWLQGGNLRERADTLGRVTNVPHFDVGGRDREDQTGGGTVFD